jgi:hypothetical protein
MKKQDWLDHIDRLLPDGLKRPSQGGDKKTYHKWLSKHKPTCNVCAARMITFRANDRAKAIRNVYASLGLKRVVGALGGVYYE